MPNSENLIIRTVKVRLSELKKQGVEMEDWLHNLISKIDLTESQRSQIVDALKKDLTSDGKQVQILGGTQNINQNIGQHQFIFQRESIGRLAGVLENFAATVKEQYGAEIGGEIIKTAIMAFANVLSK